MKKIKILWLCNIPLKCIAQKLDIDAAFGGGWLEGLSSSLATQRDYELHYCFISNNYLDQKQGKAGNIFYYAIPNASKYTYIKTKDYLVQLLREIKPDLVHIFGSEYITSYAMALACRDLRLLDRTILHIQGLVSIYSRHYALGIPLFWKCLMMPRDYLKNFSILHGIKDYKDRGTYEIKAIRQLKHVSGRTDWDRACVYQLNPQAMYHFCNETLRESFYQNRWDISKCERHSIFVSQGNYPIKGLHYILEALSLILNYYPNTSLYIGGFAPTDQSCSLKNVLRRTSYGQYILHLINKLKLSGFVNFTGPLNEKQICDRFLRTHVFVSASSIENSPNSLGEAMILGIPCVASYVGGVPNMLNDKVEGFLYQADAPYMLAYYVMKMFENDDMAIHMGNQARNHAIETHSAEKNLTGLLKIYEEINNNSVII